MRTVLGILFIHLGVIGYAQQLEPRIYSNLPQKLDFLIVGNVYSTGGFVVDAALPVEDFKVEANQLVLGYAKSLNIFGKSGQLQIVSPFVIANADAVLAGRDTSRSITGFADTRVRIGWNLIGAPSLSMSEFRSYQQKTILGISLQVVAPFGQYDETRILNLGANRWAFKPEVGLSQAITDRITLEAYGGIWIFTKNANYLENSKVEQDPLWTTQFHLTYSFGPGKPWIAANSTFFSGGTTYIDGAPQNNFQSNYRGGLTLAVPFGRKHALKLNCSFGVSTRFGQELTNGGIFYQYRW